MYKPLVSVVIASLNGGETLFDCVNSLTKSDYQKMEIVVVNNGGKDNDFLKLQNINSAYKICVVKSENNLFFTGGSNFGARQAKGSWYIFINDDTVVDKLFVSKIIEKSRVYRKSLIQPSVMSFSNRKQIDNIGGSLSLFCMGFGRKKLGRKIDYVVGTAFAINADFFWELGGFDEWYKYHYEDVDLSLRALRQGGRLLFAPEAYIYHKGSKTVMSLNSTDLLVNIRKNRLMTIFKNYTGLRFYIRISIALITTFFLALGHGDSIRAIPLFWTEARKRDRKSTNRKK